MGSPAAARPSGPSLDQILPHIRGEHPGTFTDAEGPFFSPDGRAHYRIKWLTPGGRVVWFNADARTGRTMHGAPPRQYYNGPRRPDGDPDRERGRRSRDRFNDDRGDVFYDGPRDWNRDHAWRDRGQRPRGSFGNGWHGGQPGGGGHGGHGGHNH